MGLSISFPLKRSVISFEEQEDFSSTGEKKTKQVEDVPGPRNIFEEVTYKLFEHVLRTRQLTIVSKNKFKDMEFPSICEKFPHCTYEHFMDLKAQFQSFDINKDGLIDFIELCSALDELGDTSDEDTRKSYFDEFDENHSGAVDFEEYLTMIDSVANGHHTLTKLGTFCRIGTVNARKIRKLSIIQQINHGLF